MSNRSEIRLYRPDIEGLRCIAILAVVLANAGFTTFSGGDTGISTFFVISGYLAAEVVARVKGGFGLADFYDRRARRLLPVLIVATGASLVAGVILMTPADVAGLARAALASVVLVSNLPFLSEASAGVQPLDHTSALAAGAQLSLVLPLVMLGLGRFGIRSTMVALGITFLLFVCLAALAERAGGLPTQEYVWAFAAGALVAVLPAGQPVPPVVAEGTAALGAAAVLAPVFLYGTETPRGGLAALPTILGTAALLWANRGETVARTALGASPFVFIGVISYSLFVWHWPILVFAREIWGVLDTRATIACLAVTGVVAVLSWYFVEQPFRYASGPIRTRSAVFAASLAGVASIAALAAVVAGEGAAAARSPVSPAYADDDRRVCEFNCSQP